MNIFSKRLSVVALSVTTLMWAVGAMQVPVAHAVAAGSLIKASGPAVYYLAADGKRYTFPNDKIYRTWYSDFSGVQTISDAELASYMIGGNVKYRAGTRLVKITTDPRVYAVEPGGTLRHVADEATAMALYGPTWAQQIDDLSDAFFAPPNYNIGSALSATTLPEGYLASDGTTTYYIDGTTKRPISGQSAMDANRFWNTYVHTVPAATLNGYSNGTSINGADAALVDVSQGGTVGGVVVPTGSSVSVALASDTPAAMTIPDGTIYNPLLKFNVTASADGDARLTGLTVTRGGFIANTGVSGVSVWDQNGVRHGSILTALTSDGMGTLSFNGDPIVIPAGQTRSVTVAANIGSSVNSATINMSIAGASHLMFTNTPPVNGVFPIMGNTMSVVDGSNSVGAVQVQGQSTVGQSTQPVSGDAGTLEVGNTQMEVARFNFSETSSREDVTLRQMVFYVEGDINEASDLANFTAYGPDGVALGSVARSSNRYATLTLTSPYTIPQGQNRNITVKADVTGGANRWFRLQLQNDYDVLVRGVTTGANLQASDLGTGFYAASGWQAASSTSGYFKIKQGALTISRNAASPSGNLTVGSSNVEIGRFDITANGEPLEVQKLGIYIATAQGSSLIGSAGLINFTGNLMIVDGTSGVSYYTGTANASSSYSTNDSAYGTQTNLSNYISLQPGVTKTLKVMANISSSALSGNTIQVGLGNVYVRRMNSLDYANVATGGSTANTMTIGGSSSLSVSRHSNPPNPNTLAPGANGVTIATFSVGNQSSGSETVRVNSINVTLGGTGGINAPTQVRNLKLWDISSGTPVQLGSTLGTAASSSNAFTLSWTIPANNSKLLGVTADLDSSISSGATLYAQLAANTIVGTGQTSNNTVQGPSATVTGQTNSMALASVRIYFQPDSDTLSKVVLSGTQGVEIGKFKFDVQNEDVSLYKISFLASSTAPLADTLYQAASGTAAFQKFYLYNGATLLGETTNFVYDAFTTPGVAATSASSTLGVTFNLNNPLLLLRDVGGTLTLKADINNSGTGLTSTVASFKVPTTSSSYLEIRNSQGILGQGSINLQSSAGQTTQTNTYLYIDAAPVIRALPLNSGYSAGKGATDEVARFEVLNYGQRDIYIQQLTFAVAPQGFTSGTTGNGGSSVDFVQSFKLYNNANTQLATSTSQVVLCGGANISVHPSCTAANQNASNNVTFNVSGGSVNGAFEGHRVVGAANGSTPGSLVFSLRANTNSINTSGASGTFNRSIVTTVSGSTGHSTGDSSLTDASSTRYWASGNVLFKFEPAGGYSFTTLQDASDSYPVSITSEAHN